MRKISKIILASILWMAALCAQAIPSKPEPQRLVNDLADILTVNQEYELESMLVAFDDSTSNQIAILTVDSLDGDDAAHYAYSVAQSWGVGGDKNNGIMILVKPKNADGPGRVAIQIGYGLEGAITDYHSKKIINNLMIPHFAANDYYSGIRNACTELMAMASGEISEKRSDESQDAITGIIEAMISMLLFFVVMYLLSKFFGGGGNGGSNGGRGRRNHDVIIFGPMGGFGYTGSSFGGGSFGGGSFGGGSFGGFGGGSFGGGGASGSW